MITGVGTVADPFLIASSEDLAAIGTGIYLLTKRYKQTANIDWAENASTYFPPIGGGVGTAKTIFMGTYDGDNFSISNLLIDQPGDTYVGMFAYSAYSYLKNIHLINVTVNGLSYVGGLAGYAGSNYITDNCSVTGRVTGSTYIGGLIGVISGKSVTYCTADVNVIGNTSVGGLFGQTETAGRVQDCSSHGSVVCNSSLGGGLSGSLIASKISQCYSTCAVSGSGAGGRLGGLVGEVATGGIVSDCYARGSITSTDVTNAGYVGGIAGTNFGTLINCYSTGSIIATGYLGGIAAYNGLTITNCFWDLETSGYTLQTADAGLMKTTAEMYAIATFYPSWNIVTTVTYDNSIWFIGPDYPRLATEYILARLIVSAVKTGTSIHISWTY